MNPVFIMTNLLGGASPVAATPLDTGNFALTFNAKPTYEADEFDCEATYTWDEFGVN